MNGAAAVVEKDENVEAEEMSVKCLLYLVSGNRKCYNEKVTATTKLF